MEVENLPEPETGPFQCLECPQSFPTKDGLRGHKGKHTREKMKKDLEQQEEEKRRVLQEHEDQMKKLQWQNEELQRRINEQLKGGSTPPIPPGAPPMQPDGPATQPSGQQGQGQGDAFRSIPTDPTNPPPLRKAPPPPPETQTGDEESESPEGGVKTPKGTTAGGKVLKGGAKTQIAGSQVDQRRSTEEESPPSGGLQLSEEDRKAIIDGIMEAMEAKDKGAIVVSGDGGSAGRQIDQNTTEYTVPDEDLIEKKVKFLPRIFEYHRMYMSKLGKSVSFDTFLNQVVDDHFALLGMESVIVTRPSQIFVKQEGFRP